MTARIPGALTTDSLETITQAMRDFAIACNKHVGGALSSAEFMTALYFGGAARLDLASARAGRRDHVVLSKGHAPGVPLLLPLARRVHRRRTRRFAGLWADR